MNRWSDFLQYDNPGLFTDDAQRSGMMHKDWIDTFGKVYGTPYDPQARSNCLETLGDVVGKFLANNQDKQIYSFVDNLESGKSTHGIMLDHATADLDIEVKRYSKRGQARTSPYTWIVEKVH
jgi:hypothetical protein